MKRLLQDDFKWLCVSVCGDRVRQTCERLADRFDRRFPPETTALEEARNTTGSDKRGDRTSVEEIINRSANGKHLKKRRLYVEPERTRDCYERSLRSCGTR
jgi:hypothetical protein